MKLFTLVMVFLLLTLLVAASYPIELLLWALTKAQAKLRQVIDDL
jgi:hypothetical protein